MVRLGRGKGAKSLLLVLGAFLLKIIDRGQGLTLALRCFGKLSLHCGQHRFQFGQAVGGPHHPIFFAQGGLGGVDVNGNRVELGPHHSQGGGPFLGGFAGGGGFGLAAAAKRGGLGRDGVLGLGLGGKFGQSGFHGADFVLPLPDPIGCADNQTLDLVDLVFSQLQPLDALVESGYVLVDLGQLGAQQVAGLLCRGLPSRVPVQPEKFGKQPFEFGRGQVGKFGAVLTAENALKKQLGRTEQRLDDLFIGADFAVCQRFPVAPDKPLGPAGLRVNPDLAPVLTALVQKSDVPLRVPGGDVAGQRPVPAGEDRKRVQVVQGSGFARAVGAADGDQAGFGQVDGQLV